MDQEETVQVALEAQREGAYMLNALTASWRTSLPPLVISGTIRFESSANAWDISQHRDHSVFCYSYSTKTKKKKMK